MKNERLVFLMLGMLGFSSPAVAFELTDLVTEELEPVISINRDDSGVTVDYAFPGAALQEDDLYPGTFRLAIPGFGANGQPGEAAWLMHWDTFEIPYGCEASVTTLSVETSIIPMSLAPARPDLPNSSNEGYSLANVPPVADYSGWLPQNAVEEGDVKVYRDRNILYVGVYPLSYNIQDGTVRAVDRLSYRVSFVPAVMTLSADSGSENRHDVDSDFMGTVFTSVSFSEAAEDEDEYELSTQALNPIWNTGDSYLILSRNRYTAAVSKFVAWKKSMGYNVKVVMSETWNPGTIKSTIRSNYNSDSNLKYLLLFGDEIDLPGEEHYVSDFKWFYTDHFYACMDGSSDDIPDLYYGRLSVSSMEEALTVVDKIIDYESLLTQGKGKAVIAGEFSDIGSDKYNPVADGYEDVRFIRTCEDIANGLSMLGKGITRVYYYKKPLGSVCTPTNWNNGYYGNGGVLPDFLTAPTFNWYGKTANVTSAINSGVGYVVYRGHGNIDFWEWPEYTSYDAEHLKNGKALPIVFSISCKGGMFQYHPGDISNPPREQTTCIAESFLRNKDGGGVAVIAAAQTSYSGSNDVLLMEMFQLIWPYSQFCSPFSDYTPSYSNNSTTPIRKLGEILNASKLKLLQNFTWDSKTYTTQIYNLFGDPGMEIRESAIVHPNITMTSVVVDPETGRRQYIVNIPSSYRLVRVPNLYSEKVVWSSQTSYTLSDSELESYKYFMVGENIAPIPLESFITLPQSSEYMHIDEIIDNCGQLKVRYTVPEECVTATVSVWSTTDGSVQTVECNPNENEVSVDMQGHSGGIYVIELSDDGTTVDTQKIILK